MNIKGTEREVVGWIDLAQNTRQCLGLVIRVMKLLLTLNTERFSQDGKPVAS
jgi:hypothetical protein